MGNFDKPWTILKYVSLAFFKSFYFFLHEFFFR